MKASTGFVLIAFLWLFSGCNAIKTLRPGQYLVDEVETVNYKPTKIPLEEIETYYRQRPNRKFLFKVDFYVWWYNRFDPAYIAKKKFERNENYDRINQKRIARTNAKNSKRRKKGQRELEPRLKDKDSPILLESLRDIGEAPVLLDSSLTEQTRYQLSRFLFSKGYFNNKVTDTIVLNTKTQRAKIRYELQTGPSYTIGALAFKPTDLELGAFLKDSLYGAIHKGDRYDFVHLQEIRSRLTDHALNNGYYFYESAYLTFDADTFSASHTVNLTAKLKKFGKPYSSTNDSLVYVNHQQHKVRNVYVVTEAVTGSVRDAYFKDTLKTERGGLQFLLNQPLGYRTYMFLSHIDIHPGMLFRRDTATLTYKSLLGLGIFKNVTIQFHPANAEGWLDCYIICTPLIKQSITAETQLTHTSGNGGAEVSAVYQNRNFLKGGELLEIRLQSAILAQSQFNTQNTQENQIDKISAFNTFQFGPQMSLSIPRAFFPFSLLNFPKRMSPRTYIKSSYNLQARDIFTRAIGSVDFGFTFKTHNNSVKHDITPTEIYYVRAKLSAAFQSSLNASNDAFLRNSFIDHVTTLSRYAVTYFSAQNTNASEKPVYYLRVAVASSGNLLRAVYEQTGHEQDTLGRYLLGGIPFAQFIKTEIDYRVYVPIRKKSRVVYRVAGGIGKPLKNLSVLPYEQSFFSGGPNSVRAWRARTLGPGGYDPTQSTTRFDKIGDILLEGNLEYRFNILRGFNGALFVDAGNIWRLTPDPTKPGGEFYINTFLDQIAIGGGMGIRWDLDFFVIRFDLAAPLKDPSLPSDDRWTFINQAPAIRPWNRIVVNFGIGYPF